jgi:hypothetical protein
MFRNKSAYPVYLTIGNIPKALRKKPSSRAQVLLAYLPTTKLEHITNKASRRRSLMNLFHACMGRILELLESAGLDGVIMSRGDGVQHRNHPILAAYTSDYPEQVLVTCTKSGECPVCDISPNELGSHDAELHFRDLHAILSAFGLADKDFAAFMRACLDAHIKPVQSPFWSQLPLTNIFQSITPDVLHQILQGIFKHLLTWLKAIYGDAEIDARCRLLPPNHNIRLFSNGICNLSKVTGKEHDEMTRIILGVIIDLQLPDNHNSSRLIRAVRGMLDFVYLAQYPVHTAQTLNSLDDALHRFHANKSIFIDLGVRDSFNIPKLHSLRHYSRAIKLFGTTDNYNTQTTERLHIDYAKEAYRASNTKDELPQMTSWLERKEKIVRHASFIAWRLAARRPGSAKAWQTPVLVLDRFLKMPRHPSVCSVPLESLITNYGATYIREALARFVIATNHPDWTRRQVEDTALDVFLPFRALPVFHKIKFVTMCHDNLEVVDSIHVRPARRHARQSQAVPGRFDTALICVGGPGHQQVSVQGNLFYCTDER